MPLHNKTSNLSVRSKRRRVAEDLKNSALLPLDIQRQIGNTSALVPLKLNSDNSTNAAYSLPLNLIEPNNTQISSNINIHQFTNSINNDIGIDAYLSDLLISSDESDALENDFTVNNNINFDHVSNLRNSIKIWAIEYNVPQNALNGLLTILKKHSCFINLPKDSRTLMHTTQMDIENLHIVEPGTYYHFGIENGIKLNLSPEFEHQNIIKIVVGIDGLPLFKSSSDTFWPILAYISPYSKVFPIGVYHGKKSPSDSNKFISHFVEEAKLLIERGIQIDNQLYNFKINVVCCDAPAKSYILKIKGHAGFFSCSRCEQEGEWIKNRVCFRYIEPERRPPMRTHQNYIIQKQDEHHVGNTSLMAELPNFDIVKGFSMDYLHLICLGTVRKLINFWINGPVDVRYPSWKINDMSKLLVKLKSSIPCEIARKTRSLDQIKRWKATEYRTFILYVGAIVTKNIISVDQWKHFLNLSLAMTILLSPDFSEHIDLARQLLDSFVEHFGNLYGTYLMSHNIHGLIHLCDDYINYGPLDHCSTFPFENYMSSLKRMIRKPHKPLEQVVNRYKEIASLDLKLRPAINKDEIYSLSGPHKKGPLIENQQNCLQFTTMKLSNFTIKTHVEADSYLITKENIIIKVVNIMNYSNDVIILCKQFEKIEPLFRNPISSYMLDMYVVSQLSSELNVFHIQDIKKKMCIFPSNNNLIALPLIHTLKQL